MFIHTARKFFNTGKRKLQSYAVNNVSCYSFQIMNKSTCSTCGKSVKDRNSIKCNLCLKKVNLKLC